MTTKFERQGEILRLVQQRPLSTQAEVADALRAQGIDTVQATVSRDITQLGLVKVRNPEGRLVYALPGAADFQDLILRRRVAFVVDADHFQSIPAITILQRSGLNIRPGKRREFSVKKKRAVSEGSQ